MGKCQTQPLSCGVNYSYTSIYFRLTSLHRLLLKIHHTAPGPTGDIRRTRFLFSSFSSCDEFLAVADHRGNIFVVDLANSV